VLDGLVIVCKRLWDCLVASARSLLGFPVFVFIWNSLLLERLYLVLCLSMLVVEPKRADLGFFFFSFFALF
jgi:hypothetical protein